MTVVNQQTTNANTPSIVATAGVCLQSNVNRVAWNIQNLGTNALYVCLGPTAVAANGATGTFHVALKGATVQDDGSGGAVGQETGVVYTGPISVAGTSPRFVVLEQAP